jgi:hypothetical protein
MYKKYVTRNGKRQGPYYYESVRLKSGKIKTIYLGRKPDKGKLAKKLKALKLEVSEPIKAGETIIIPVSAGYNVVRDALALAEIFGDPKIRKEKFEIKLPRIKLPSPGIKDVDFTAVVFFLISIAYVFGFFFLESGITGYSVSGNSFLLMMGLMNMLLALLILVKLKGGKD